MDQMLRGELLSEFIDALKQADKVDRIAALQDESVLPSSSC